jgi:dGTPase
LVRTRLTHTLEVTSIAREVGRGLGLRDPLIEAIALGHDLGHPAFGHAGERALAALVPGGFHHAAHGVRIVTVLEPELDLSPEVVDGILKHSKGRSGSIFARGHALSTATVEALAVRAADLYAYACHDLDDAFLLGVLDPSDVPKEVKSVLGSSAADVRQSLVTRTVKASSLTGGVALDAEAHAALSALREFLYGRLYEGPQIARQTSHVRSVVGGLWEAANRDPRGFLGFSDEPLDEPAGTADETRLPDFFVDVFAAMTDRQALELHARVCRVRAWSLPSPLGFPQEGPRLKSAPGHAYLRRAEEAR